MTALSPIVALAAAALFAALGVGCFVLARREPEPRVSLAGIGRISPPTFFVAALCCVGLAYHIVTYAFDLKQFRAPWWLAVTVAALAVLLSLGVDAMENGRSKTDSRS